MNDRLAMIGRLAAGVAHDLNNYLAVVDASFALRQRRGDDRGENDAREAVRSATRLTRCLADYARGGEPEPAPVELGVLVRRVIDVFGRVIPAQVRLVLELDGSARPVRGVAAELEQLVLNLVLNACDAMSGGGELFIAVRASGYAVVLEVADTGGGLTDDISSSDGVSSPSNKPGRGGSGLGLGIVRSVAERHRARLDLGAHATGTRATVTFLD
jgi:signal transduction histidine kinase